MNPLEATWFEVVTDAFNAEQWYQSFHVTTVTFIFLLGEIRGDIFHLNTRMRKAVAPERCLALSLYYLASTAEYRIVAHLFHVSTSVACRNIKAVCEAIDRRFFIPIKFLQGADLINQVFPRFFWTQRR